MVDQAAPPQSRLNHARALAGRVLAGVLAVVALIPFFGLIDLGTVVGLSDPNFVWQVPLEASWGALFTFFIGGGYAWLSLAREPRAAAPQLSTAAVALGVATIATGDPAPLLVGVAVAVADVLLWLLDPRLRGRRLFLVIASPRWPHLLIAITGLAIWLPYAVAAAVAFRAGADSDVSLGIDHWPIQCAAGVAVLLAGLLLVVRGAPLPLRLAVALTGLVVGLATVLYPDRAGATGGPAWGAAAIAWSLAVAVVPWIAGRLRPASRAPAERAGTPPAASSAVRREQPR